MNFFLIFSTGCGWFEDLIWQVCRIFLSVFTHNISVLDRENKHLKISIKYENMPACSR